ncbi:hypothetical protein [uncultured Chitinophaga sp.]|uniref:hypothetical protein n=1 Tax=uncultured Chitinophaga sp. TaxID=339340 RepID=UPI002619C975|nr:hypothetical protein [uncultured Chitinophaga sp.]
MLGRDAVRIPGVDLYAKEGGLMDQFPDLPSPHWEEQLPLFWYYVKWFLKINQVWVMIGTAVMLATTILIMIANLFNRNNDDDDDYDYREI